MVKTGFLNVIVLFQSVCLTASPTTSFYSLAFMTISLPQSQYPAFAALIQLTPDQRQRLLEALRVTKPSLDHAQLSRQLSKDVSIPVSRMKMLLSMFVNMYAARLAQELSAEQFAQQICDFAAASSTPTLKPADGNWEPIRQFIAALLNLTNTLGVIAKAAILLTESERLFGDGRIITEIRPVFADNLDDRPSAAIIVHTLRIQYSDAEGSKEFYVALKSIDVQKLKKTTERALTKEQNLRRVVHDQIHCLEIGEEE